MLQRATRPDGSSRYFEVLLRSTSVESNATGTQVIASRSRSTPQFAQNTLSANSPWGIQTSALRASNQPLGGYCSGNIPQSDRIRKLADKTVPTKRKQAVVQAWCKHGQSGQSGMPPPIFPRSVCRLIRGNAHNRFMPIKNTQIPSIPSFPSICQVCARSVPKIRYPHPPRFYENNRVTRYSVKYPMKTNDLKLGQSRKSAVLSGNAAVLEPSRSRTISQRHVVGRSCDRPEHSRASTA